MSRSSTKLTQGHTDEPKRRASRLDSTSIILATLCQVLQQILPQGQQRWTLDEDVHCCYQIFSPDTLSLRSFFMLPHKTNPRTTQILSISRPDLERAWCWTQRKTWSYQENSKRGDVSRSVSLKPCERLIERYHMKTSRHSDMYTDNYFTDNIIIGWYPVTTRMLSALPWSQLFTKGYFLFLSDKIDTTLGSQQN
jgi:hypothetical protein